MPYDPKKDQLLAEAMVSETERSRLTAKIMSYDGGEPKLQLSRQFNVTADGTETAKWIYRKVGRTTIDECHAVEQFLKENDAIFHGPGDEPPVL